MKRRTFLAATTAFATLPIVPALASRRVTWEPGTLDSPYALLVSEWINEAITNERVYTRGGPIMDMRLELRDPTFVVKLDGKMWRCVDGYTDETTPTITLHESGIYVDKIGICSTERLSLDNLKPHYVGAVWMPWRATRRSARP